MRESNEKDIENISFREPAPGGVRVESSQARGMGNTIFKIANMRSCVKPRTPLFVNYAAKYLFDDVFCVV